MKNLRMSFRLPQIDSRPAGVDSTSGSLAKRSTKTPSSCTKTLSDYGVTGSVEEVLLATVTTFEVSRRRARSVQSFGASRTSLAARARAQCAYARADSGKNRIGCRAANKHRIPDDLCGIAWRTAFSGDERAASRRTLGATSKFTPLRRPRLDAARDRWAGCNRCGKSRRSQRHLPLILLT